MRIPIVDENDTIIGVKERDDIVKAKDIYRVSALWLTNSQGQILLAQRAFTKSHHPGCWGPAVAGTVEDGETYEENIKKETAEELGLNNLTLTPGPKIRRIDDWQYFTQWYQVTVDQPAEAFRIKPDEVVMVKWFSRDELIWQLHQHPEQFLTGLPTWLEMFK
ncbi:NUDIX domain-containing protein [Candidatus Falkowbacteria bacterium]|nr:NUDIX domain-containing protein [Candidatus Falkowbacteria bacterium]